MSRETLEPGVGIGAGREVLLNPAERCTDRPLGPYTTQRSRASQQITVDPEFDNRDVADRLSSQSYVDDHDVGVHTVGLYGDVGDDCSLTEARAPPFRTTGGAQRGAAASSSNEYAQALGGVRSVVGRRIDGSGDRQRPGTARRRLLPSIPKASVSMNDNCGRRGTTLASAMDRFNGQRRDVYAANIGGRDDQLDDDWWSVADSDIQFRRKGRANDVHAVGNGNDVRSSIDNSRIRGAEDNRHAVRAESRSESLVTLSVVGDSSIGGDRVDEDLGGVNKLPVGGRIQLPVRGVPVNEEKIVRKDDRNHPSFVKGNNGMYEVHRKTGATMDRHRREHRRDHRRTSSSRDGARSSSLSTDRSCQRRSKYTPSAKRWLKPEKFDGKSSVETFVHMFENCASYNGWTESDKAAHLRWSLTGVAAQLLWDMEGETYNDMIKRLKDRFGGKGMEEKYQSELRCRRRGRGENLRELAQDIRRLMMLAYPGEKSSLAEHIARDAFLVALDDAELELKVREREPVDLDSALKICQRYEVFRSTTDSSSGGRHRVVRRVEEDSSATANGELKSRVDALEALIKQLSTSTVLEVSSFEGKSDQTAGGFRDRRPRHTRKIARQESNTPSMSNDKQDDRSQGSEVAKILAERDELVKELGRLRSLEQSRATAILNDEIGHPQQSAASSGGNVSRSPGPCFRCGVVGHFSRSCPMRRSEFRPAAFNENGYQHQMTNVRGTGACFNCGLFGHYARDCRAGQQPPQPLMNAVVQQSIGQRQMATYLPALIEGQLHQCLLDTGSDVTLLPANVVEPSSIRSTSQTLKAANGTIIPVLGEASVWIVVGRTITSATGLVSEYIGEIMLGIDWLTSNCVIWDFSSSSININGDQHGLVVGGSSSRRCCRVAVENDVTIPARSQMDISTKVLFKERPERMMNGYWGTESASIQPGVYSARTLIPADRVDNIPVRVINVNSSPVHLSSKTTISNLQPVSVEDISVNGEQQAGNQRDLPPLLRTLIDGVHDSVPESIRLKLQSLLLKHMPAFSTSEDDLGLTNVATHRIDTEDARPVRQPLRRYPPAHQRAISEQVETMLKQKIIEPAVSPWASNIVLVRKKGRQLSYVCRLQTAEFADETRCVSSA